MTKPTRKTAVDKRFRLTTNLFMLRQAYLDHKITYRQYMEIAKALGGARKYGKNTAINLRFILDTFPRHPHVVYLGFCGNVEPVWHDYEAMIDLMRLLLREFCQDMQTEYRLAAEMPDLIWTKLSECLAYLENGLAGNDLRFNSRIATDKYHAIELGIGKCDRIFCARVQAFIVCRKKSEDFTKLYLIFIEAVTQFHGAMRDGHLIDTLKNPKAKQAGELVRCALLDLLKPDKPTRKVKGRG